MILDTAAQAIQDCLDVASQAPVASSFSDITLHRAVMPDFSERWAWHMIVRQNISSGSDHATRVFRTTDDWSKMHRQAVLSELLRSYREILADMADALGPT